MSRTGEAVVAVVLLVGGVLLALLAGDEELLIFRGQPLGIVLAAIGALDLASVAVRRA